MAVDATIYGSASNASMKRSIPHTNWDTVHDAATALIYNPEDYSNLLVSNAIKTSTGGYSIYRSYLYFDLSGIAVGSEIGTVQLYLYVTYKDGAGPSIPHPGDLYITQGVQADPIVVANFGDQLPYTTSWGYIAHNDITINQYNAITLNAAGLAALNLGGAQKFCLRVYYDLIDNPVTPNNEADTVRYYSQEQGGDYRPKLVFGEVYKKAYPTADITRVTAIRHIYRPGLFRMEVTLGDVQNAIDMIDTKVRKEVGVPSPEWLERLIEHVTKFKMPTGRERPPTYPPYYYTPEVPGGFPPVYPTYTPPPPPQYTPEVPQPPISYPQYPSYYTPEVPQRPPISPTQPSPLDIFKERMWKFMEDPLTSIMETWRDIKWW